MLGTLSLIHCVKLLQPFSKHPINQQVSAYNCRFLIIIQSHDCKEILFSLLKAKKIADAVWPQMYLIKGSQHPSLSKRVWKDGVFLGLAGLLIGISLWLHAREIPWSSPASPWKTLSFPPLLLRLTQYIKVHFAM